jgi:Putative zinc-finger
MIWMALRRLFRRHERWAEVASAFVDRELPAGTAARFEAHLIDCARCKGDIEAMRHAKLLVSRMPEMAAPRSFRLTPQMVVLSPSSAPGRPAPPSWALRSAQFATGVALVVLVGVAIADLSDNSSSGQDSTAASLAAPAETNSRAGVAASAADTNKSINGQPAAAPSPAPQQQAPSSGGAPGTGAIGSSPAASGNSFSAPADASGDQAQQNRPGGGRSSGWYRLAELFTGGAALLLAFATAYLLRRRRYEV